MADTIKAELEGHFGRLPDDVLFEAKSILRLYALSPSDLFFKWEAFLLQASSSTNSNTTFRKQEALAFNLANLRELKKEIQVTAGPGSRSEGSGTPGGLGVNGAPGSRIKKMGGRAALDGILDGIPATPLAKKAKFGSNSLGTPSSSTPIGRSTYNQRTSMATTGLSRTVPAGVPATPLPSHLSRGGLQGNAGSPGDALFASPSSSSTIRFEDRKNAGELVETLNGQLSTIIGSATDSNTSRIALASNADPRAYSYRYMFEKLTERADVLNNTVDEYAEQIRQYYEIEDLGHPALASQEDIYCVGRICPETDGLKLSDTTLWFESSRLLGSGERVRLQLDSNLVVRSSPDDAESSLLGEGGVGLFPGMIVGIKGRNPGGSVFTVSEVLLMPPVDQPESSISELIEFQHGRNKLDGQPMSVVAACGPYTIDDDLHYAPLAALLDEMTDLRPDLLILLGPFVDASHPHVKTGEVDMTPQQIFQTQISSRLSSFLDYSLNTTVILVPSVKDLVSHNYVFPQAPLDRDPSLGLHKRAKLLPNPATFQVNEVGFAVTSVDTIFSLKSQEFFKKAKDPSSTPAVKNELSSDGPDSSMTMDTQSTAAKDPLARICRHVLRQRSLYPLFPSPNAPPLEPLNLDVTHSDLLKFNAGTGADVFIMPSMLKHFAKVVDSAVMINPSFLTKKNQSGTYARLTIYPTDKSELQSLVETRRNGMKVDGDDDDDEEATSDHKLYERCRVDIVRI